MTVSSATVSPRTEYYLAITAVHDSARPSLVGPDQVVGFVRLACGSHQAAKLGYAVHADQWGRGLASHAVSALCRFGFDHLDECTGSPLPSDRTTSAPSAS